MTVSPLATATYPADRSNYTQGRVAPITKITVHHMAAVWSAERCGQHFQVPGLGGSTHYGIGVGGEIANYVNEDDTAWADSSWASNSTSITIENSNDVAGGEWHVGDATLNSLIKLCADIAKRYNLGRLIPGQNLTWHSMYWPTTCPGDYLRGRMQYIADEANKINDNPAPAPAPEPVATEIQVGDKVLPNEYVDYYGTRLVQTRDYYDVSEINGDRAVLTSGGIIYAAMNVNNLHKVGGAPAPAQPTGIQVGDRVVPINLVDVNGTPLVQYDDSYVVTEISGGSAVLEARGVIWARVALDNLRKV